MNVSRFWTGLLAKRIVLAVGVVTLQAAVALAIPVNPEAYYSFDSDGGAAVADDSGNGNSATLSNGAVHSATGKSGGSLSMPNTNSTMLIDTPVDIDNIGWTVAAWYRDLDLDGWRTLARGSTVDHQLLLENVSERLGMYANGHGNFRPASPQFDIPSDLTASADGWHHVAAVGTGGNAGSIDFYVDGAFAGTADEGSESNIVSIGNWGGSQRFAQAIDEVYIYQRALNAAEVGELFQLSDGSAIPEPSTLTLAALGLLLLGFVGWRRRRWA